MEDTMVVMVGKEFDVIEQSTSEEDRACCCEACACDVCVSCPYLKDLCNLLSKLVPFQSEPIKAHLENTKPASSDGVSSMVAAQPLTAHNNY
eukprot:scaffold25996_cov201-Skeletonema_marinoi.AAC.11